MGKSLRFAIEYRSMAKTGKATPVDDQGKAFIEAARELGCDESEEKFDEALRHVAQHKPVDPPPKPTKLKSKKPAK